MGQSLAALAAACVIAIGALGAWSCTRGGPVPASAEAPPVRAVSPPPTDPPAPSPLTNADAAVASCPLLTREAFEKMSASLPLTALGPDEVALVAVGLGDEGLAAVKTEHAAEIGRLLGDVFKGMSSEQRDTFANAVGLLREGKPLTPAHATAAAAALRDGAGRLRPDASERLRALYSASIESSFAARAAAMERTRTAVAVAATAPRTGHARAPVFPGAGDQGRPTAGVPASVTPASSDVAIDVASETSARAREAQEAMWRRRRADREARVREAEQALAEAERAAAHVRSLGPNGGLTTDGDLEAYRAGVITALQLRERMKAREERERAAGSGSSRTSPSTMTVAQATANLATARAALDRLDDEARQAGVPAGWVR